MQQKQHCKSSPELVYVAPSVSFPEPLLTVTRSLVPRYVVFYFCEDLKSVPFYRGEVERERDELARNDTVLQISAIFQANAKEDVMRRL